MPLNVLYTYIAVDGKKYALPETEPLKHRMELDFRHGIFFFQGDELSDGQGHCDGQERNASPVRISASHRDALFCDGRFSRGD